METYLRAMDAVYRACIWIAGIAIVIMSLVIPWGVFARKVLDAGASWPEPVAIFCMVIFTFFGAAATYRANGHIAVDIVTRQLPPPVARALAWTVHGLMIVISLFMIVYGLMLCQVTWNQSVDSLPALRVGLAYLPLPLGSLVIILFVVEQLIAGPQDHRPIVTYDHEKPAAAEGGH